MGIEICKTCLSPKDVCLCPLNSLKISEPKKKTKRGITIRYREKSNETIVKGLVITNSKEFRKLRLKLMRRLSCSCRMETTNNEETSIVLSGIHKKEDMKKHLSELGFCV